MKRKTEPVEWAQRYQKALCRYLFQELTPRLQPALKLGRQAVALGMETLELAQIHEQALMSVVPPGGPVRIQKRVIAQAKNFFDETNSSIEKTHVAALKQERRVRQSAQVLARRTAASKASLLRLKKGILQRKKAEAALLKSGAYHAKLLRASNRLRNLLRNQMYELLHTHEKERKYISRTLLETLAQSLLGFNIELLALKASNKARTDRFSKETVQ